MQRGIGNYVVVEANYIGSRGRNMYVSATSTASRGDLLDGRLDRILPGFSSISLRRAIDESHYHGARPRR